MQPPDEADREEIFRVHTKKIPCGPDVRLRELAVLTEGYTGADIKLVCREAAISALEVICALLYFCSPFHAVLICLSEVMRRIIVLVTGLPN